MINISVSVLLIIGLACMLVGYLTKTFIQSRRIDGIFHIDTTNPNKDYIRFEMISPIGVLEKKKRVIFEVKQEH